MTIAQQAGQDRRRYPRKSVRVKTRLQAAGDRGLKFEASLPSGDISIGGIFLESEFFVKKGTQFDIEFELADLDVPVKVRGEVVRIRQEEDCRPGERTGFGIAFIHYYQQARTMLATYFLAPEVKRFLTDFRKRTRNRTRGDEQQLVDLLVAWELDQFEKGRGRLAI